MKILSAKQMREADAASLFEQQIEGHELMERAARALYIRIKRCSNNFSTFHIVCGTGNNGGDGLCVARYLLLDGYRIKVFIAGDIIQAAPDFQINYNRLKKLGFDDFVFTESANINAIKSCDCIIDALLAAGLNRPPENIFAQIIEVINQSEAFIISIDTPSGLFADIPTITPCVQADITFSFETPKLAFFFPENIRAIGEWIIVPIGISHRYLQQVSSEYHFLEAADITPLLQTRNIFSHKGTNGRALIVAGKIGMIGAAQLCSIACLTAGAGLVTLSSGETHTEYPELMTIRREDIIPIIQNNTFNSIGIGPGLGTTDQQLELLKNIFSKATFPLVIDADALNIISEHPELLQQIPPNSILTPHPKEFERMFGKYESWDTFIQSLRLNAEKYCCHIIYKRAFTIISNPDGTIYFNSTGNPGMGTAGSGDVLTGIITALLAQGYDPKTAALAGVFLHGTSGDIAMQISEGQNIIAGDIIEHFQNAWNLIANPS